MPCVGCKTVSEVSPDATSWQCPACRKAANFRPCSGCGDIIQVPTIAGRGAQYTCPFCSTKTIIPLFASEPLGTAAQLCQMLARRGLDPDAIRSNRVVGDCIIAGGFGHELPDGLPVLIAVIGDQLQLQSPQGQAYISVPCNEILALEIGGTGAVTSGGGFFGGGFGVGGALQGMITSAVLNSLTTKTSITTVIRITVKAAEFVVVCRSKTPDQLSMEMSPVLGRIRAREAAQRAVAYAPPDLTVQLAGLAQLHHSGALSDAEFAAAKARLLTGTG